MQTYPEDPEAHHFLGANYIWLGQFDKALFEIPIALKKEPTDLNGQENLGLAYLSLNRFADAQTVADNLRAIAPNSPRYFIYSLSFIRNDSNEMHHQLALANAEKEDSASIVTATADTAAYHGHIEEQSSPQLIGTDTEPFAIAQLKRALWEAEFHAIDAARRDAREALAISATPTARTLGALVLARVGDVAAAEKLVTPLEKRYPPDSLMRLYYISSARAALALNRNHPDESIDILRAAANVELSRDYFMFGGHMYPVYLRGLALLALHQEHDAASEFQKIIEHKGLVGNCPLGALANLQLGRAYAMQPDSAKAKAAYQDFLTLWKDADPDIPILKQAKAEYAKLQ